MQLVDVGGGVPSKPAKPKKAKAAPVNRYTQLLQNSQNNASNLANQFSQNKYDNYNLGLTQQEQTIRQQMGQLYDDNYIRNRALQDAKSKYADAILGVDRSRRDAQSQYAADKQNLNTGYQTGQRDIHQTAFQNKEQATADAAARGLYNSSILDTNKALVGQAETQGIADLSQQFNNNMATLDRNLASALQNLNEQKTSLTQRQQAEAVQEIQDMMKQRDDQKANYNLLLQQIGAQRTQGLANMGVDAQSAYQDLLNNDFGRQFELMKYQDGQDLANREFNAKYGTSLNGMNENEFAAYQQIMDGVEKGDLTKSQALSKMKQFMYAYPDSSVFQQGTTQAINDYFKPNSTNPGRQLNPSISQSWNTVDQSPWMNKLLGSIWPAYGVGKGVSDLYNWAFPKKKKKK